MLLRLKLFSKYLCVDKSYNNQFIIRLFALEYIISYYFIINFKIYYETFVHCTSDTLNLGLLFFDKQE